jgi:hypothetical protein
MARRNLLIEKLAAANVISPEIALKAKQAPLFAHSQWIGKESGKRAVGDCHGYPHFITEEERGFDEGNAAGLAPQTPFKSPLLTSCAVIRD